MTEDFAQKNRQVGAGSVLRFFRMVPNPYEKFYIDTVKLFNLARASIAINILHILCSGVFSRILKSIKLKNQMRQIHRLRLSSNLNHLKKRAWLAARYVRGAGPREAAYGIEKV